MQERVRFDNRDGHQLVGVLHLPDTQSANAFALFAHCFTCTKNIKSASIISDTLAQHGIATLRFDFTGLGSSQGDFSDSSFTTNINDLIDAAEYLQEAHQAPQLLVGHSLGGTAILAAAAQIPSAKAVASIGSPANPEHILQLLQSELATIEQTGEADVDLAGRQFTFRKDFVADVRQHDIDFHGLNKALMVMHSPLDATVSVDQASKIFASAIHPKSFVSLDSADHLLSKVDDARYAAEVLACWASRYMDSPAQEENEQAQGVYVSADTKAGFVCHIDANGHQQLADEPIKVGGTNLGPTPYDYLASALGTCTAMTLNMYARHKKLPLENVSVQVEHRRIHAEDCVDCEKQLGQIDQFTRSITIKGELNEAERERLLQIADRCPVHKTLENEIKIVSQLN